MVQINFAQKSVTVKIVYYGPGMSGKTTNLEVVHQRAPESNKGDLTSISTDGDRTLFFDFMPLDLGTVAGMRTQFQIYTVPGQVYYNSTRKLVLQGVDGVIFIADSGASMLEENLESLANLAENLKEYGKDIDELPIVIQYNKRDLPDAMTVEELQQHLNVRGWPQFEATANSGHGVFPTLKALAARVLDTIHEQTAGGTTSAAPPQPAPAPQPQPAAPQPAAAMPPPAPQQAPQQAPQPSMAQPTPPAPTPAPAPQPAPLQVAQTHAQQAAPAPQPAQPQMQMQQPAPQQPAPQPPQQPQPQAQLGMAPPPPAPAPPAPMPQAPAPQAPAPQAAAPQAQPAASDSLRMATPPPHAAPEPVRPPQPAPRPQAQRPPAPQRTAPGPRQAAQAPAGRLRPRAGSTAAVSAKSSSSGKSKLITAVVVVVALAAGAAIGGSVFNLI